MTFNALTILQALESHALALGVFDAVNRVEPKSAPRNGVTCAIWAQSLGPARGRSGLASSAGSAVFTLRIYTNMIQQPEDMIDPNILSAADAVLTALSGDFSLGGNVLAIDLLGSVGPALGATAGYINIDGKMFRVMDITIPIIVSDVWEQVS